MTSVTPTTLVDREDIALTPGADRTNSHGDDHGLHARRLRDARHAAHAGGHQVDWLIDGVPIPNTNIATNLGPQIDPKDIDYMEIQRGSYDAQYGDSTYGIFNIVPGTGFESNNEAELVASFGNWYQTNDQINFASHPAFCLLCEPQRKSQRLWPAAADRPSGPRRRERLRRIRLAYLQRQCLESISPGRLVTPGLLPDSN